MSQAALFTDDAAPMPFDVPVSVVAPRYPVPADVQKQAQRKVKELARLLTAHRPDKATAIIPLITALQCDVNEWIRNYQSDTSKDGRHLERVRQTEMHAWPAQVSGEQ